MNAPIASPPNRDDLPAKRPFRSAITQTVTTLFLLILIVQSALAGTWSDDFSGPILRPQWRGDRDYFSILDGTLNGISASPLAPVPLRWVEVSNNWDDYVVRCQINVVTPNLLVCTKGALILRHNGNEGYVFALHVATQTVEVYRLSDEEMLLSKAKPLELQRWYRVRAELQGDNLAFFLDDELIGQITDQRSASGSLGLAVQDALSVLFDDFTVTGPKVQNPALSLSFAGSRLTLSWPATLAGGTIQTTAALAPPIEWTTVTNTPVDSGDQKTLVLDIAAGTRFYRLTQPAD